MLDGIEVVELSEVDLDFALEEMFGQGAIRPLETTSTELAAPDELAALDLFRGLSMDELTALAASCQSIQAVPGYVVLAPGRLNTKVYFVVEGQLRLYAQTGDKRPMALVDVGHSTGLRSALAMQPAEHAVIATEISNIIVVDVTTLDALSKRLHVFALNYMALQASYVRGDNCLFVGARSSASAARQGYIDELTLLHNQHWLTTMLPRLVARFRLVDKPLAVVAFAVDKLDQIVKEHGIGAGLRVLEAVGHWTLDQTRPIDILAVDKSRCVFAFLPDCDLEAARQLAGRLKTQIQTVKVSLASAKAPDPITLTLSLGIAVLEKGMKENELLGKTEALIQKSIKLGGNWLSDAL
jgi:diguanylate cyclase (GGDEF)-like protein